MALQNYDETGALGGLFAPAFIASDPLSQAAVDAWNKAHLKTRPKPDVNVPPVKPTPDNQRDAIVQALLSGTYVPQGAGGDDFAGPGAPTPGAPMIDTPAVTTPFSGGPPEAPPEGPPAAPPEGPPAVAGLPVDPGYGPIPGLPLDMQKDVDPMGAVVTAPAQTTTGVPEQTAGPPATGLRGDSDYGQPALAKGDKGAMAAPPEAPSPPAPPGPPMSEKDMATALSIEANPFGGGYVAGGPQGPETGYGTIGQSGGIAVAGPPDANGINVGFGNPGGAPVEGIVGGGTLGLGNFGMGEPAGPGGTGMGTVGAPGAQLGGGQYGTAIGGEPSANLDAGIVGGSSPFGGGGYAIGSPAIEGGFTVGPAGPGTSENDTGNTGDDAGGGGNVAVAAGDTSGDASIGLGSGGVGLSSDSAW